MDSMSLKIAIIFTTFNVVFTQQEKKAKQEAAAAVAAATNGSQDQATASDRKTTDADIG